VAAAIRLARDGQLLDAPRKSPAPRIYVEGGQADGYAITADGLRTLRDDPDARRQFVAAALSFRAFLDHWRFVPPGSTPLLLGPNLWPAQEEYARIAAEHPWVFYLKARQLGETTIACAFDAWRARFGPANARCHVFSKMDAAACDLLDQVADGLAALPDYMRLPLDRSTAHIREYHAAPGDTRVIRAYAADKGTSRGSTAIHCHVDEWAFVADPASVWRSVEPTLSGEDTTCHLVTTGHSPQSPTSIYYRKCVSGDGKHFAAFAGALDRPRPEGWLEGQAQSMPLDDWQREYATSWEMALAGGDGYYFRSEDIDAADIDARPPGPAEPGRKYVTAWDIGLVNDASVGTVLDITEEIYDVVQQVRLTGITAPELQNAIKRLHYAYPGMTVIEDNSMGYSIRSGLDLPSYEVEGFSTTGQSKPRILGGLKVALQRQELKWSHEDFPDLTNEMRGYQLDDSFIVQDCVMSLAIALNAAAQAHLHEPGRIVAVIQC
jgi:hypothetical protein